MPVCASPLLHDVLWTPEEKAVIFSSQDVSGYQEWQHSLAASCCVPSRMTCLSETGSHTEVVQLTQNTGTCCPGTVC